MLYSRWNSPLHLLQAISSEACCITSNRKVRTRNIIYADNSFVTLLHITFIRGLQQVVKYPYLQITDFCNRKTKAITTPIPNFVFILLHLFERTNRICEIIKSFQDLSLFKVLVLQLGLRVGAMPLLVPTYRLWS